MEILTTYGNDDVARVYVANLKSERYVEFVESKIPGFPREKKWVIILSSLCGCPVNCPMCDAGMIPYNGALTTQEILSQIDYLVDKYYPGRVIPVEKFKIQFARIGEPSFNNFVLEVLDVLPYRYKMKNFIPCVSTIAPKGKEDFFERLMDIKNQYYSNSFQLQFSIHSTSEDVRSKLIPVSHWGLESVAKYGESFARNSYKKVTLNFAVMKGVPIDPQIIIKHFNPKYFLIKLTPLNPTQRSLQEGLLSGINVNKPDEHPLIYSLRDLGYDVIVSVGELEENLIGSNCGQYIRTYLERKTFLPNAYTYVQNAE